ncbi:unnamed protein product [Adineta ricciae]|uniref:Uncharacterized protein n=1 Tax=Adineta ricciae TaxID=249248 RepID=A0A814TC76_ADIRI|nr:unnamed protein product [Adineta ricciae]CAF1261386.1 unnamed protein product [Adineta ricciae]
MSRDSDFKANNSSSIPSPPAECKVLTIVNRVLDADGTILSVEYGEVSCEALARDKFNFAFKNYFNRSKTN